MTTTIGQAADHGAADQELKQRHRAMWALGDYDAVATEVIASLGPALVAAAGVGPGDRVLDVAAGSGNAAVPAARLGAEVVASDLTPELLERGRRRAADSGVELRWEVADAEALPYRDGEFDVVLSCVGVMFAPHHQVAADELVRVCRPGGRIALIAWTPAGFVGQMFAAMKPHAAPPPPGAQPPPLWGDPDHVAELLGARVEELESTTRELGVARFPTPEAFRDYFKINYGPTVAVYRRIADDPDASLVLDQALVELGRRFTRPSEPRDPAESRDPSESSVLGWEYLLTTARRRG